MNLRNIVGQARRLPIIRPGNRSGCPTTPLFAALDVYHDADSRSAAVNMAIDEALLETAKLQRFASTDGIIRRYRSVILEGSPMSPTIATATWSDAGPAAELFYMAMI